MLEIGRDRNSCYFHVMYVVLRYMVFLLLTVSLSARGQCPSYKYQPEFMVSYGMFTPSELADNWRQNGNGDQRSIRYEATTTGADFFTARFFLYSCLSIGLSGGYVSEQGAVKDRYGTGQVATATYNRKSVTVAVELNYIYKIKKYLDVYTFIGTGPAFVTLTNTSVSSVISPGGKVTESRSDGFVFHYSPVGVRVGGRIGGFAELGYGYKGLLSGGLSVRLGRRWCKMK